MALPNYYGNFNPNYNPNYNPQPIQPQAQMPVQQTNNFIPVPSEDFARNYPVALGMSVSFKDENAPYIYTKTMGPSQLSQPIFEKYKLIKEEDAPARPSDSPKIDFDVKAIENTIDELKSEIDTLHEDMDTLRDELDALKVKKNNATKKKDSGGD